MHPPVRSPAPVQPSHCPNPNAHRCSQEIATRALIIGDIAPFLSTFPCAFAAAAHSHRSDHSVPDLHHLMLLPLPDLVRTHTYLMLSWWVLCYIIAIVCHESSPSLTDT